jgi:hypothetical protein
MEAVDGLTPELTKIFAAKQQRRHELANLPFPEKVQAVVQLQNMTAAILRGRGKTVRPWNASKLAAETPQVEDLPKPARRGEPR